MIIKTQQDGFAMIEVLLAIVILSIGLLASSRMQIMGLNYTQSATTRSHAIMAANDILDRMRLNPTVAATYAGFDTATSAIPDNQNCVTNTCDATQRANQDLRIWSRYFRAGNSTDLVALLPPDASGSIQQNGSSIVVTVTWNDLIQGNEEEQTVSVSAVL